MSEIHVNLSQADKSTQTYNKVMIITELVNRAILRFNLQENITSNRAEEGVGPLGAKNLLDDKNLQKKEVQ